LREASHEGASLVVSALSEGGDSDANLREVWKKTFGKIKKKSADPTSETKTEDGTASVVLGSMQSGSMGGSSARTMGMQRASTRTLTTQSSSIDVSSHGESAADAQASGSRRGLGSMRSLGSLGSRALSARSSIDENEKVEAPDDGSPDASSPSGEP
jgi:hypothetical protein